MREFITGTNNNPESDEIFSPLTDRLEYLIKVSRGRGNNKADISRSTRFSNISQYVSELSDIGEEHKSTLNDLMFNLGKRLHKEKDEAIKTAISDTISHVREYRHEQFSKLSNFALTEENLDQSDSISNLVDIALGKGDRKTQYTYESRIEYISNQLDSVENLSLNQLDNLRLIRDKFLNNSYLDKKQSKQFQLQREKIIKKLDLILENSSNKNYQVIESPDSNELHSYFDRLKKIAATALLTVGMGTSFILGQTNSVAEEVFTGNYNAPEIVKVQPKVDSIAEKVHTVTITNNNPAENVILTEPLTENNILYDTAVVITDTPKIDITKLIPEFKPKIQKKSKISYAALLLKPRIELRLTKYNDQSAQAVKWITQHLDRVPAAYHKEIAKTRSIVIFDGPPTRLHELADLRGKNLKNTKFPYAKSAGLVRRNIAYISIDNNPVIRKFGVSINIPLHEYGHLANKVFGKIYGVPGGMLSNTYEFRQLFDKYSFKLGRNKDKSQRKYPNEFFAEVFADFYDSDGANSALKSLYPAVHTYFKRLEHKVSGSQLYASTNKLVKGA